jgi:hypothetical protein
LRVFFEANLHPTKQINLIEQYTNQPPARRDEGFQRGFQPQGLGGYRHSAEFESASGLRREPGSECLPCPTPKHIFLAVFETYFFNSKDIKLQNEVFFFLCSSRSLAAKA